MGFILNGQISHLIMPALYFKPSKLKGLPVGILFEAYNEYFSLICSHIQIALLVVRLLFRHQRHLNSSQTNSTFLGCF